jgi:hypothetical protein
MQDDGRPDWDQAFAERLAGATVLVGITYDDPAGRRFEQFYGTVMKIDPNEGVALRLEGGRSGEIYSLPPDLRGFSPARPGSYRLSQTGEVVVDPDYTSIWTITPPAN